MQGSAWVCGWGLAALLLAGCDNTKIAFCSGSDEFCDNFFEDAFRPEDDSDPPDDDAVALEPARAIALSTPDAVATALTQNSMQAFVSQRSELVGLWLAAGTLARMTGTDNLTSTQFLDQQRAWLAPNMTADSVPLAAGFAVLAAFAERRDPSVAELAAAAAASMTHSNGDAVIEEMAARAQAIVNQASAGPCCSAEELAAATVMLCGRTGTDAPPLEPATRRACDAAAGWLAANP